MTELTYVSSIIDYSTRHKIRYYSVSDSLFLQFEYSLRSLYKALGPAVETRIYTSMIHLLKKIRYKLSVNPLPYNQVVSDTMISSLEDLVKQGKALNPEHTETFDRVLEVTNRLYSHDSSALLECMRQNILRFSSYSYCIVTKKELTAEDKNYILTEFKELNITFMNEKIFRKELKGFDYVIFMGNESYFHHSFNNTPKSKITVYISRDIYQNNFMDNSLLIDWPFSVLSTMYKNTEIESAHYIYTYPEERAVDGEDDPPEAEEQIQEPGMSLPLVKFISESLESLNTDSNTPYKRDLVPAKAFELHGERFILICISKGSHDVITSDGKFTRKQVNDIVPGDSLVLSSVSDEHLVERMADEMYKDEGIQTYRKRQAILKNHLLKITKKKGIDGFCRIVKHKGLNTINENKIKNLLKPESFKLQSNQEYWDFLLIVTKNDEQKAMKFFEAGKKLSAFHIGAGRRIREILRESLGNTDSMELLANGTQEIELEELEGLRLEIRKVEEVGDDTIPISPHQNKKVIAY